MTGSDADLTEADDVGNDDSVSLQGLVLPSLSYREYP